MNTISKLHIYSCSHETLIQIRQPHPTRSKTYTNTFRIIRSDHIDAPCEACRRKLMLKAKATKQLQRYREFINSKQAPKELDWVRQRSRQRSVTGGTVLLERRIPRKPVPTAVSDLRLSSEEAATSRREDAKPTHNKSIQLVTSDQQTPARKCGHRHAVVINNHLLEANGQESEVWFAEPQKQITGRLSSSKAQRIEGLEPSPARKDDRATLPSERRRQGRRSAL
ncbi:hypothetical protein LTR10_011949 [Elasticomyces elasticus]|nr:hypothetical protein LTR10_011949 [Elasticomyces elasticus]KAK4968890.1 hypothetical protein LTR42_009169 [Elasticomyces elasticus]